MSHEELKAQYEADALWHPKPWRLWLWGVPGGAIFGGCNEVMNPAVDDDFVYRRKPDAPERNCAMCKHRPKGEGFGVLCRHPDNKENWQLWNVDRENESPEWCPLTQKEEPYLLTAARDLLKWLEGFELMRGAEKVRALMEAVEEAKK